MNKYSISIIIPNYNGKNLLEKHLSQVVKSSDHAEIIVVDDNSDDGSVDYISQNFPDIIIVKSTKNYGFAHSVNAGVNQAKGDIVILINSDVEPQPGYLKPLIAHFQNKLVFAVGCMDKSYEKAEVIFRGRGIASWQKGFYIHSRGEVDKADTAWVSGGSGAFRKSIWDQLDGMDEIFSPFYWEDIDLSYRARKAGYLVLFESKSIVHHYHEHGAIKKFFSKKSINIITFRNQLLFIWKNLTNSKIWIAHLFWLPIRVIQSLLKGNTELSIGLLWALSLIPKLIIRKSSEVKYIISDKIL
jgi:O-antigen biosynthesis protein